MFTQIKFSSRELRCLHLAESEIDIIVTFEVTLRGIEVVPLTKDINVFYNGTDIKNILTVSDWAYILKVININLTYNAAYLGHKLEKGM